MIYTILSLLIVWFIYLVKKKLPKSSISVDYFKEDLELLKESEIPTY